MQEHTITIAKQCEMTSGDVPGLFLSYAGPRIHLSEVVSSDFVTGKTEACAGDHSRS